MSSSKFEIDAEDDAAHVEQIASAAAFVEAPQSKATPAMQKALLDLQNALTCPLCGNVYVKPVTISCGHTFCCSCIDRHADNNWECPSTFSDTKCHRKAYFMFICIYF